MASSRVSLSGPDWKDIAQAVEAFEKQNSCRIVTTIRSCQKESGADMWLEAKALSVPPVGAVPVLLGFAQLSCGQTQYQTMEAAFFKLLYQLDFQLAEHEWNSVKSAK